MVKDKKNLLVITTIIAAIIIAAFFILNKSKNKELILTIDKVYLAYSSYVVDLGHSPESIDDLLVNQKNIAKWNGPYISKTLFDTHKKEEISIIKASNIPTKPCSIDYLSNCYNWIKVSNLTSSDFTKIKETINKNSKIFFANDNLYFKLSVVE